MANVLDFSQLRQKVTPWGDVLDPITEELKLRAANQEKRDMQELRDAPERAREDRRVRMEEERQRHNRETEGLNERRQVGAATIQNSQNRGKTEDAVRAAIAAGEIDKAEQLGTSYQELDPQTAAMSKGLPGFKIDRGLEPSLPPADSARPDETVDSVLANPDSASITDPANDAAVKEWQRKQAHPDIMIAGVKTTPDALRYSASRANAADMQKTEDALNRQLNAATQTGDLNMASVLQRQLADFQVRRAQVESRALSPSEAARANDAVATQGTKATDARALQGDKDKAALARTNVNAGARVEAATAGVGAREAAKTKDRAEGLDPKTYARVQADLKDIDKQYNISTDRSMENRYGTLLNNMGSQIVQRASFANIARGIGAEKGVLTDKDVDRFSGHLGGLWGDVSNWLEGKGSGDFGPEKTAKIEEALRITLAEKHQDRLAAEKAYEKTFLNPTYVGHRWGYTNEIKNGYEARFGHPPPEPGTAAAPAGARPGRPARDPSNPDDPNAPDAGRPLDGDGPPPPAAKLTREEAIKEARRRGLIK